jgi:hypothetical protein
MAVKLHPYQGKLYREFHGSVANAGDAFNIAIVAEGYTQAELQDESKPDHFWNDGLAFVKTLISTPPFSLFPSIINVFGVAAISPRSAREVVVRCPAPPLQDRKTAFEFHFCDDGSEGGINGNVQRVKDAVKVDAGLPFVETFIVLVNSRLDGGQAESKKQIGWFSRSGSWARAAIHELGHAAFDLADEYDFNEPSDSPRRFSGTEPARPNLTINLNYATLKWRSFVSPLTPLPTTVPSGPPSCSYTHPLVDESYRHVVGAFEGGGHNACGIYTPAIRCLMDDHNDPFCPVCARHIATRLFARLVRTQNATPTSVTPVPGQPVEWTHVVALPRASSPTFHSHLLLYSAHTGAYQLHDARMFLALSLPSALGTGTIEKGLAGIVPVVVNGQLKLLTHSPRTMRRFQYGVASDFSSVSKLQEDLLLIDVTHLALALQGGQQRALSYSRVTGRVAMERVEAGAQIPTALASEPWEPGWTLILPLRGRAEGLVLCYEWQNGYCVVRALPSTFTLQTPPPVWAPPAGTAFMLPQLTHAVAMTQGGGASAGLFVVGYSALTGITAVYSVRAGGRGLDLLARDRADAGAPMMPSLKLGVPALDRVHFLDPITGVPDRSWLALFSRSLGRITLLKTTGN